MADEERIWRTLQADIARLVPNGRHIVAEESGHDNHTEQPALVVDAILDMATAVRNTSA